MTVIKSRAGHPTFNNLAISQTCGSFFVLSICDCIWEKQPVSENIYSSRTKTLMEIKKKKQVLLEGEASYWLQIGTMASSFNLKGNNEFFFLANRLLFPNTVTDTLYEEGCKLQSKKRLHVQQFCLTFFITSSIHTCSYEVAIRCGNLCRVCVCWNPEY